MMRLLSAPFLMIALFLAPLAVAADAAPPASVAEAKAAQIELASRLRSSDYRHVNARHRQRIASLQEEIATLPDAGADADLSRAQDLSAAIDGVLADAELDREVCTREKSTGSNRVTRVCRTKRQIAEQQRAVRDNGPLRSASGCGMETCPGG
ncbi:MAG: hypothetical protein O9303_07540 [Silanimonas sp.]|jgi:hypothetical protein|nr:hypothetical protein [Silanimonas sp.]